MAYKHILSPLSNSDLHNLVSEAIAELVTRAHTVVGQAAVNTERIKKWELAQQLIKDGMKRTMAHITLKEVK